MLCVLYCMTYYSVRVTLYDSCLVFTLIVSSIDFLTMRHISIIIYQRGAQIVFLVSIDII